MSIWHAFHFLRPWWLLALLVLPLLPWLLRRASGMAALSRLVDAQLLPFLVQGSDRRRPGMLLGTLLAWTLGALALAGPTWQREPQPVFAGRSAQVVVVSLSQRMLATDVRPDRMTRVRYKIHALLDANKGGQNALVAYAGAAFTVAPLTSDANALGDLLDALSPSIMPVAGDDAAAGIRRAVRLLQGAGDKHGSIVLIDDHADTGARSAARGAAAHGMRVSVLGVGTAKGAPIPQRDGGFQDTSGGQVQMARRDDASLGAVARAGGGRYVRMSADGSDIAALKTQLQHLPGQRDSNRHATAWRDQGPWLLLLLLPLAALAFRRGVLLLLPLLVLLPLMSAPVHAGGWRDAWRTRDQQAAQALAAGHPKKAQQLAQDPALRGTAAYRAGDYASASKAFAKVPGAQGQYNLGNALAKMHRYQDAIDAYTRALHADPQLADAYSNRKAIRDWLKRQRKPKSGNDSDRKKSSSNGSNTSSGKSNQGKGSKSAGQNGSNKSNGKGTKQNAGDKHRNGKNASGKGTQGEQTRKGSQQGVQSGSGRQQSSPKPQSAADNKAQKQARSALKKNMDRALGHSGSTRKPYALGSRPQDKSGRGKQLPAQMRQALQQVKDDPGGLLRRKFMLEYQRRQQRGDTDTQAQGRE